MKISAVLDNRKPNQGGKFPVILRFANLGLKTTVSLGIYVFEHEFDKVNQLLYLNNKQTRQEYSRHNVLISNEINRASALLLSLELDGKGNIFPAMFKELLFSKSKTQTVPLTFISHYKDFLLERSGRTREIYEVTLNKILKFSKEEVCFESIDYSWLQKFESFLKKRDNAINTISIDLRNIRAVFNDASKKRLVSKDLYPFDNYKIKNEETEFRSISVEKLRMLFTYTGTASENWSRDVAKIIFYLIGINASDLFDLSYPADGRVNYRRDKTGRLYSIILEPEALALVEQFKGKDHFLCFQEQFKNKSDFLKKLNGETIITTNGPKYIKRGLNSIGDAIGVQNLTSYVMRHTWATIAGKLDIAKETIAKSLGHGKKTVTDVYVNFDRDKIDEANRRVIDYLIGE